MDGISVIGGQRLLTAAVACLVFAGVWAACGSQKEPVAPVHYDQRANPILAEKPTTEFLNDNPEAMEIGCCAVRIDEFHWTCSVQSQPECVAASASACQDESCLDGQWGYLPRVAGEECFRRCSYMDELVMRTQRMDEIDLDVPQGSWEQFRFAQNLAAEGRCSDVDTVMSVMNPDYMALNRTSMDLLRAQCRLTGRGEIENAEEIAGVVYNEADGSNTMTAAGVLSDARKYSCDFDGAIEWAYHGDEARPTYLAPEVIVNAAQLFDLQGRPELAARAARSFVTRYPFDYYESDVSNPPEDQTYNRTSADELHKENRATAWRILAANEKNIAIPEADLAYMRRSGTPVDAIPPQYGEPFFETKAAEAFALFRAHEAIVRINARESLGEDAAEVEALTAFASAQLDQLPAGDGPCELLAERLRERLERIGDMDGDGIPDDEDECPEEPETFNGFEDEDGCPDIDARIAYLLERQIVINERVQFRTDSAELRAESRAVLDDVAAILKEFPNVKKVRVEGHTDARGTDEYNLDLSQRRADSVRTYLVNEGGIDPDRLVTRGFGESQPLAFGEGEEVWRLNRRVEFFILEADVMPQLTDDTVE